MIRESQIISSCDAIQRCKISVQLFVGSARHEHFSQISNQTPQYKINCTRRSKTYTGDMARRSISNEDKRRLIDAYEEGRPYEEVAAVLGIKCGTAYHIIQRLKNTCGSL